MSALVAYVNQHTQMVFPTKPRKRRTDEEAARVADLFFFEVEVDAQATADKLRELVEGHASELSPNDGVELLKPGTSFSYMQLGAWIGSQELALRLMGLGNVLGLWQLITPRLFARICDLTQEQAEDMAGRGYVMTLVPKKEQA